MRIVKLKQNGDVGPVIMQASHIVLRQAFSDAYCVCFEALGLDKNGDSATYRLTLTRNEVTQLQRFADLSKKD